MNSRKAELLLLAYAIGILIILFVGAAGIVGK